MVELNNDISSDNTNQDKWLDLKGLINYLPSKPKSQTVYGWVNKRIIPYYKNVNFKSLLFLKSDIDEWLKAGKQKTNAEISIDADNYLKKGLNKKL